MATGVVVWRQRVGGVVITQVIACANREDGLRVEAGKVPNASDVRERFMYK
jgi:hypothetical protein